MEKKNNSGILGGVLIGIIIMLLVIGGLFVTGTINFKENKANDNMQTTGNEETSENSQTNENQDNSNHDVDESTRNKLFDIVGIPSQKNKTGSNELNDFVSKENYKENANNILKYTKADVESVNVDVDIDECAPRCIAYTKENAEKLIKIYNFSGTLEDYFVKSNKLDNIYIKSLDTGVMREWNGPNAGIKHESITSEYFDNDSIRITDKQVINKYDKDNGELNTTNQTTVFEFKKDNTGSYYLSNVTVK